MSGNSLSAMPARMPSTRNLALAVAFAALVTLPFWIPGIYYINVSSQVLFYAIFALGLNLLVGYGGVVWLGYARVFWVTAHAPPLLLTLGGGPLPAILRALSRGPGPAPGFAAGPP